MLYIVIALLAVVFTLNDTKSIYLRPNNSPRSTWCLMSDCYTFDNLISVNLNDYVNVPNLRVQNFKGHQNIA